jgi:enoyl-CoA hydratase/carnithine racemase
MSTATKTVEHNIPISPELKDLKFETLQVTKKGNILDVWLNRPERRNAWNSRMHHEMEEMVVRYAEDDPDIKVITVRGRGKIFSAGHDLIEVASGYSTVGKPGGWDPHRRPGPANTWYCSKPFVSGVHEYVGPIAWAFLADTDFVIAAEGTRFSLEQARMGGGSAGGTSMLFHFPPKVWKKLIMLGGWMSAEQAHEYGFVSRVVPRDKLDEEVEKWATEICKIPLKQLQAAKINVHRQWEAMGFLTSFMQSRADGHGSDEDMKWFKSVMSDGLVKALKTRDTPFDQEISRV